MRVASCLSALIAGSLTCSALTAPPVFANALPHRGDQPPSDTPVVPPRPNSPIPRAEGIVPPPSALQFQQWMDALLAAWRAGRCDELAEGIKEMRSWLWVKKDQIEGLKSILRSEQNAVARENLSRRISEMRDLVERVEERLDWLERQPCPPPPPEEPTEGNLQPGQGMGTQPLTARDLGRGSPARPALTVPGRGPAVITLPPGTVRPGLIRTPNDIATLTGPRQTTATPVQQQAQGERYEELLGMWEQARRLDSEHEEAARRCDLRRMAAIRAELNALYSRAQTLAQTLDYVRGQTGASGVPDSPGFLPPGNILDQILRLTDKADRRRPRNCGGEPPVEDMGPPPPSGGESSGEAPPPPPETQSPPPPEQEQATTPVRSPSPADGIAQRAHSAYNRALDAAMGCDEDAWRRAIAELEALLRVIDSELAILNDPLRRRERLMNTPARIQRLSEERAQIERYLEQARRLKLRCAERDQSGKRLSKGS